jgi:hypothetical protein
VAHPSRWVTHSFATNDNAVALAEEKGFEPPGLLTLSLSRRVHLSALPLFRQTIYRAHIPSQMENDQKPHPATVATVHQKPDPRDESPKSALVFHHGHWCTHAIEPAEMRTVEDVRQLIEAIRDERCW